MKIGAATPQSLVGLLLASAPYLASAYSAGAGTCVVTSAGPAFPVGTQHDGKGEVDADGNQQPVGFRRGWAVSVGDTVLAEGGNTTEVTLGKEPSEFKIAGLVDNSQTFLGFLITLTPQDSSVDLSGLLKPLDGDATTQALANGENATNGGFAGGTVCKNGIAGGTHKGATERPAASMVLDTTETLGLVDVTVTVMKGRNSWYHSNYVMNVQANETDKPTSIPTSTPTAMPVAASTETPTSGPTASPTSSPTTSPTASPSAMPSVSSLPTPSPTTSFMPTMAPVTEVPTSEPTVSVMPSATPSMIPTTSVPTAMPVTEEPTEAPVTGSPEASSSGGGGAETRDTSGTMPRGGSFVGAFVLGLTMATGSLLASWMLA